MNSRSSRCSSNKTQLPQVQAVLSLGVLTIYLGVLIIKKYCLLTLTHKHSGHIKHKCLGTTPIHLSYEPKSVTPLTVSCVLSLS